MITAFDPLKGRGKVLRTVERHPLRGCWTALSPDGSTLAISLGGEPEIHIRLLALSGGSDREITVKGWPNVTGLYWSADGKGLYCGAEAPQASPLLYVDLKGNARVLWQYKGGSANIWGVPSLGPLPCHTGRRLQQQCLDDGRFLRSVGLGDRAHVNWGKRPTHRDPAGSVKQLSALTLVTWGMAIAGQTGVGEAGCLVGQVVPP